MVEEHFSSVGILAGNGFYPVMLSSRINDAGISHVIAGLKGQTVAELFPKANSFLTVPIGAFKNTARFFLKQGINHIYFAGGIRREGVLRFTRPDTVSIGLAFTAIFGGDDCLLRNTAKAFSLLGIEVLDPSYFFKDCFVDIGHQAGPSLDADMQRDIQIGQIAALELGKQDRGQSVICRQGLIVGRENRRGTDYLIRRHGCNGAVLVKTVKPKQDKRFDLPTIGPNTIIEAAKAGISALGIEAGGVLMLQKDEVFTMCEEYNISLYGVAQIKPLEN